MAQDNKRPLKIIVGADSFEDALLAHLRSLDIEVEDIDRGKYYNVGQEISRRVSIATAGATNTIEIRGLVTCGTGVGVSIFANKFPGVYTSTCVSVNDACNTRSINNCNVLAVSGISISLETGIKILESWLETPFKSPCPASGDIPWPAEIETFLNDSITKMSKIGLEKPETCAIFCLAKNPEFTPVDIMPGGSMKIVRESSTLAIVTLKAGSVEPAHHHTFGHDLVVMKGRKSEHGAAMPIATVVSISEE